MPSFRPHTITGLAAIFLSLLNLLGGATITLKDGTVLENAEVKGESPTIVYVQIGDELKSYSRSLVPKEHLDQSIEWADEAPPPQPTAPIQSSFPEPASTDPFGSSAPFTPGPNATAGPSASTAVQSDFPSHSSPFSSESSPKNTTDSPSPLTFPGGSLSFADIETFYQDPTAFLEGTHVHEQALKLQDSEDAGTIKLVAILTLLASFLLSCLIFGLIYWPFTILFSVKGRGIGKCLLTVLLASLLCLVPHLAPFFLEMGSQTILILLAASALIGPIIAALTFRHTPVRGFFSYLSLQIAFVALLVGINVLLQNYRPDLLT